MADGDCVSTDIAYGPYLTEYNWDGVATAYKPANAPAGWFSIGITESVQRINRQNAGQDITATQFGDTVIDGIYTGGNTFASIVGKEWFANSARLLYPWGGTYGTIGPIGASMCDAAGALRLTPIAGGRAAAGTGTAIMGGAFLFRRAIMSNAANVELLLGNTERLLPFTFQCFPYLLDSDSAYHWFEYFDDTANIP